jgi:hypothetical protein
MKAESTPVGGQVIRKVMSIFGVLVLATLAAGCLSVPGNIGTRLLIVRDPKP